MVSSINNVPLSRYKSAAPIAVGRLIALSSRSKQPLNAADVGYRSDVSIEFPAMPDTIELARSTEYWNVNTPITPDGMHQYKLTRPLEIQLSFKLHAMDKVFCDKGALTLLQMAARLHSFILPVIPSGQVGSIMPMVASDTTANPAATDDPAVLQTAEKNSYVYTMTNKSTRVDPPVTCFLDLIWAGIDRPGISCVGYVKDVRVRLMGPWLRGSSGEFNLPSAGEFEFTFVHHPAHNNNWSIGRSDASQKPQAEMHAFAADVHNQLYNTRALIMDWTQNRGLLESDAGKPATATASSNASTPALAVSPKSSWNYDYSLSTTPKVQSKGNDLPTEASTEIKIFDDPNAARDAVEKDTSVVQVLPTAIQVDPVTGEPVPPMGTPAFYTLKPPGNIIPPTLRDGQPDPEPYGPPWP